MKKLISLLALVVTLGIVAAGCGCGGGAPKDAIDQGEARKESDLNDIAQRVHGDFNALTAEEKARFIAMFGNKTEAKRIMKMMAHPPNEKHIKK